MRTVNHWYSRFVGCYVTALFLGFNGTAEFCGRVFTGMDFVDNVWNSITAPGDLYSDGIVGGNTQNYPNATENFKIFGGDSHPGEPNSDLVLARMRVALSQVFLVPPRN